jgi:tetratricopeptide (TPR) repeat protein
MPTLDSGRADITLAGIKAVFMKRLSCFILVLGLLSLHCMAQKKAGAAKPAAAKKAAEPPATQEAMRAAFKRADYAEAITIADRMLVKKPGDKGILVVKTMAYGEMGNKEMARKTADLLYPHSPDTEGNFLAVLPLNLSKKTLKQDGAWYIAEGHKLAPNSPIVYMVESSVYMDDSAYDKARTAARAGIARIDDKTTPGVQSQLANLLHMAQGQEEAYQLMDKVIATYPNDTSVRTAKLQMLVRDKKHDAALALLQGMITASPSNNSLIKDRAFLYEEMNRHGDACSDALRLAEEDDDYFRLLLRLGCPQAYAVLAPAQVKTYRYDVYFNGANYEFLVTPSEVNMNNSVRFGWRMTSAEGKQGNVTISKAALDTAHGEVNTFAGGDLQLSNATTVWVSNAVYKELKQTGKSQIQATDGARKVFEVVDDDEPATITNTKGQTRALKNIHVKSEDDAEHLWINDDPANPIITRMDLGWTIALKSIE